MNIQGCPLACQIKDPAFCHLMEMCLGDQQFVILLPYLDAVCIFAANVS